MDLSIVIPAYNEADRLPGTLRSIRDFFRGRPESLEVIVVDDGSTDETIQTAKMADPDARIVSHPRNLGKGAAVRSGMLAAQGDQRYLCDADLSTPISDIDHFLVAAKTSDIVIGSRRAAGANVTKAQSWWKSLLGQFGNVFIQLLATPGIKDSQCGFKLFAAHTMPIFELQTIQRWGYDFEILFLARQCGFRVTEIPVTWVNDPRSKVKGLDYFKTFAELFQIRLNDLRGRYKQKTV